MSYTYECNVICSHCENECVTGEPMETPAEAKVSAKLEARANRWVFLGVGGGWLCEKCQRDQCEHPQAEWKQEVENDEKANL